MLGLAGVLVSCAAATRFHSLFICCTSRDQESQTMVGEHDFLGSSGGDASICAPWLWLLSLLSELLSALCLQLSVLPLSHGLLDLGHFCFCKRILELTLGQHE